MIYKTKRLILSPFQKEDITDQYLSWFQSEEVTKYNSHGLGSYSREDSEKYLEENKDNVIFKIEIKPGIPIIIDDEQCMNNYNEHIGNISLQNINSLNRSAEFACVFGETDYWNKGFATESLKVLIDHGFKKMNLNRIWTGTQAPNIGMQNVAKKLGLKKEGVFREGVFLNGRYEDVICYGILKSEWLLNYGEL